MVAAFRDFSLAVDGANQMALQLRQFGRQMTWSHAVRTFMLRHAAVNAFTPGKRLGLIESGVSMWDFYWSILVRRYFGNAGMRAVQPSEVHGPVKRSTRQTCDHCRLGTTSYVCTACGKYLHIKCFVAAHDM